jgi:pyruvate dehydrogenase E2 component (dihydrolipoamide acetyltransferase)
MIEFKLPDIGEGIAEGEIVKWLVSPGSTVEEHQPVVEVMTDKATVEIPAPASGTLTETLAEEGDVVPVGSVIFILDSDSSGGESAPESAPESAHGPATEKAPAAQNTDEAVAAPSPGPGVMRAYADSKVLAVPSARRVARELGVDLAQVSGTGRNGVIRRADVESFQPGAAASVSAAPPIAFSGAVADQRVPFRGMRRKVAEAMARSVYTAPHFTIVEELDVTNLVRIRGQAKEMGAAQGIKVTYMPFIMAAVARCLLEFRMLNGHLDEEAGEIVNPGYVNLGIATDTPNGLMVPVISNVESKGMMALAQELTDLAARARDGTITSNELRGSTFTITNAGNIGGILATPIINFPDIAILGVHRIVKRPGVVESSSGDRIEIRHYMNLSCSVDHRLADGADAARFVSRLRTLLEEPALLAL